MTSEEGAFANGLSRAMRSMMAAKNKSIRLSSMTYFELHQSMASVTALLGNINETAIDIKPAKESLIYAMLMGDA
jgi:hypothetical protein